MINYSDLAFTSQLRYERVVKKSHITFSLTAGAFPTFTIPHNLGYVPFFKLFYSFDATNTIYPMFSGPASFNIDGNNCQVDSITADTSNITVQMENDNASGTLTGAIYYRIYAESGQ